MQQKPVVEPGYCIGSEGHNEVQLGPGEYARYRPGVRPQLMRQHQEGYSDDDAAMRNKEAEEPKIGKAVGEIWCEHRLHSTAYSPKIGYFKPVQVACQECHDDHDHCPVTEL